MNWAVLLEGGPPSAAKVAPPHPSTTANGHFACPDNCAFDQEGRLWVTTDGNHTATAVGEGVGVADGLFIVDTDGPTRGRSRLFFRACVGAELTGPCFTPDNSTLFLSVQHPGRTEDGQEGTSWPAAPGTDVPPRSSVVALTRKGGAPCCDGATQAAPEVRFVRQPFSDERYDVFEPLGSGGMATVYKGRDRESGALRAIKVLDKNLATERRCSGVLRRRRQQWTGCLIPASFRYTM